MTRYRVVSGDTLHRKTLLVFYSAFTTKHLCLCAERNKHQMHCHRCSRARFSACEATTKRHSAPAKPHAKVASTFFWCRLAASIPTPHQVEDKLFAGADLEVLRKRGKEAIAPRSAWSFRGASNKQTVGDGVERRYIQCSALLLRR